MDRGLWSLCSVLRAVLSFTRCHYRTFLFFPLPPSPPRSPWHPPSSPLLLNTLRRPRRRAVLGPGVVGVGGESPFNRTANYSSPGRGLHQSGVATGGTMRPRRPPFYL